MILGLLLLPVGGWWVIFHYLFFFHILTFLEFFPIMMPLRHSLDSTNS
jgi:hypothetical protein